MEIKKYKLGEICEIKAGYKQKLNNLSYWENGTIPYYRAEDVGTQTLNPSKKLNKQTVENLKISLTTSNSVLVSAIGTVGSVFYSNKAGLAYAGTVLCLEPNLNLIHPNYLCYLLLANKERIKQLTTGSTEIVYNDTLLKILQKHLEIGDLLFLKYKDSKIKVGDEFSKAIHDFFHQEGFYYVATPIITSNDTEGAGELFNITTNDQEPFFSKSAKLTVSGQLQSEALAQGLEPEMTFTDLEGVIDLAEKMIKYTIDYVLNNNLEELDFFTNYNQKDLIKKLRKILKTSFKRVDYKKCIEILVKNKKIFISSGIKYEEEDLQTEHEKYLCQYFDSPVFVINYPRDLKAFYMKNNSDGKTVACFDLLFPEIGELIGGSMREDNYQTLQEKADKQNLDTDDLS
nr:15250_t:CDS:2 [Entrophospora candida]